MTYQEICTITFHLRLNELILDEINIEKTRGENGEIVCRLPLPETKSDEELPYVSIVTLPITGVTFGN